MSRGPYPILLMLAMSLPGAARALGLGDIRVDSALNEPLSAQIDIVGATRDDLIALTAKVPNREIFQRYGAERPSFLSSASFKVGLDAHGRPVLNVRSAEAFTDPVINFLVELRWAGGELVRDYSLLLDPAGFSPASHVAPEHVAAEHIAADHVAADQVAAAARGSDAASLPSSIAPPVGAAPSVVPQAVAKTARETVRPTRSTGTHHRVAARDTLRGIARRAGARSESRAQRMMIAIFRANPHAFEGNINRLHSGALLSIPSVEDAETIDAAAAKGEFRAHMTAWRLDGRPVASRHVAASPSPVATPAPSTAPAPRTNQESAASATDLLKGRVQSLEQALDDMHRQLTQLTAQAPAAPAGPAPVLSTSPLRAEVMHAPEQQPAPLPTAAAPQPASPMSSKTVLGSMAIALALLLAGFAYVRRQLMRGRAHPKDAPEIEDHGASSIAFGETTPAASQATQHIEAAPLSRPAEKLKHVASAAPAARDIPSHVARDETTQNMAIDTEALERSYLDLGVDTLGIDSVTDDSATDDTAAHPMTSLDPAAQDTAILDTSMLETAVIDRSDFDPAATKTGIETAIIDTKQIRAAAIDSTVLDYNLLDLDATAQHVHMPSQLHDHVVVSERRTNIVDVLKTAIDRDPHRRDLRMKLLETYYSAAATNQRAFIDVVRKLAREREFLSADDWQKVVMMGREIAADDTLFSDQSKDDDLANCA